MVARQRLTEPTQVATERRLQRVERAAPIGFSSITRGGLRVQSADGIQVHTVPGGLAGLRVSGLQVVDGTLRITGLQVVDGTLRITGTVDGGGTWSWTGTIDQTGSTFLRGPVRITGANGTLEVEAQTFLKGKATLSADLVVDSGGKITAGNVKIEPNRVVIGGADGDTVLQDSRMTFANGSAVRADSAGVQITQGNAQAAAFAGIARLRAGIRTFSVSDSGGYSITNLPTIPRASANNATVGTLYVDGSGSMYRVV